MNGSEFQILVDNKLRIDLGFNLRPSRALPLKEIQSSGWSQIKAKICAQFFIYRILKFASVHFS